WPSTGWPDLQNPVSCSVFSLNRPSVGLSDNMIETEIHNSRSENVKTLFVHNGDLRSPWARRLLDVIELHMSDLGGAEAVSEAERATVRGADGGACPPGSTLRGGSGSAPDVLDQSAPPA